MKLKLLRSAIDKLPPKEAEYVVFDTLLPGFALRVKPSGHKTFVVRYRPTGGGRKTTTRTYTIGAYPKLTPEQARELAQQAMFQVASGHDPAQLRKEAGLTVSKILDGYLKYLEGRASHKNVSGLVKNHLRPAFGRLLLSEVTPRRVRAFWNPLEERGQERTASACLTTLLTAIRRTGVEPPKLGNIKLTTWVQRERAASREELHAVLTACRDQLARPGIHWPWTVYLILLLILTGARPSEIRTAKWADVDLERGILTKEQHKTRRKTKRARHIELSPAACELISRMPSIAGNEYLIPGHKDGTYMKDYQRGWRSICAQAGVSGLWVYDLRRTFTSMGLGQGFTLDQLGKALGHSHAATTAGYAWLLPNERKKIATNVGAEIAGLVPGFLTKLEYPLVDRE